MRRKKLNTDVEKNVLIYSRRRCAICYGLKKDLNTKRGQIAHIDKDSSNNSEDNLLFLCLECHDIYDSKTSQSKGITEKELKFYRDELFEAILSEKFNESELSQGISPDVVITKNVIKLLGNSNAINWLQNLVLTASFKDDYLGYLEDFVQRCEQDSMFCFKDSTFEQFKLNIYQGISEFMSIHSLYVQYDVRNNSYQLSFNNSNNYEVCLELEKYRVQTVSNYFEFVKYARKLGYI